jgi:hypothetical protein
VTPTWSVLPDIEHAADLQVPDGKI